VKKLETFNSINESIEFYEIGCMNEGCCGKQHEEKERYCCSNDCNKMQNFDEMSELPSIAECNLAVIIVFSIIGFMIVFVILLLVGNSYCSRQRNVFWISLSDSWNLRDYTKSLKFKIVDQK
jgi:hypothetical protein